VSPCQSPSLPSCPALSSISTPFSFFWGAQPSSLQWKRRAVYAWAGGRVGGQTRKWAGMTVPSVRWQLLYLQPILQRRPPTQSKQRVFSRVNVGTTIHNLTHTHTSYFCRREIKARITSAGIRMDTVLGPPIETDGSADAPSRQSRISFSHQTNVLLPSRHYPLSVALSLSPSRPLATPHPIPSTQ
jgi:hypothetical protein